ncbi:MAG: hypothetical protein ABIY55_03315 [Kofleriaceae bacterium]
MSSTRHRLLLIALVAVMLPATRSAWADDPPPPVYQGPSGEPVYLAPLSQQTQGTYVPQSVAMSGPAQLNAIDDLQPAPAGYTPVLRKRKGLIIGGAVTFGVTYAISSFAAAIGSDTSDGGKNEVAALWIPVAGPFVQLADTDSATGKFFLVGLGGAQLAGAIMLFTGLTSEHRVFVRNDLVSSLSVGPLAAKGAQGLALSGQF